MMCTLLSGNVVPMAPYLIPYTRERTLTEELLLSLSQSAISSGVIVHIPIITFFFLLDENNVFDSRTHVTLVWQLYVISIM